MPAVVRVRVTPGNRSGQQIEIADPADGRGVDLVVSLRERAGGSRLNAATISALGKATAKG